jgi:uncharacterized protein involved in oxidation of intracellular sulfur
MRLTRHEGLVQNPRKWTHLGVWHLTNGQFEPNLRRGVIKMKLLFIISTDDGETIYNGMRLANVAVNKGDEVSVFMLGKGVLFEKSGNEQFDVMGEVNRFEGDFYV